MHVSQVHREFDKILLDARQKSAAKGGPVLVTCRKGCFACCKEPVVCTPQEIDHAVAMLPPQDIEEVKEKTKEWVEKVRPTGILLESDTPVLKYRALNASTSKRWTVPSLFTTAVEL